MNDYLDRKVSIEDRIWSAAGALALLSSSVLVTLKAIRWLDIEWTSTLLPLILTLAVGGIAMSVSQLRRTWKGER